MSPNTTEGDAASLINGAVSAAILAAVRECRPLVHHITNSVTINDCANITIAVGAAPVMAEAPEEVAEMVAAAGALVLNIGTLTQEQVEAMLIAGRRANELGIPVILDPVGVGATAFRTETAWKLLDELDIAILKGNTGEIGVLAGAGGSVRGVDSAGIAGDPVETVQECARLTRTVVAMTGDVDIVADQRRVFLVENGDPMMERLSGTGCMVASVTGAFASVTDDHAFAAASALAAFGLAGERAASGARGPYSFRTALVDELFMLTRDGLIGGAKIEEFYGV